MRATTMPLRPMSDDPARAWRLALLNASLGALFLALVPAAFFLVAAHPWAMLVTIPVNACAFTGLFILAHEAIHGTLLPGFPRLGHALGRLQLLAELLFETIEQLEGRGGTNGQHDGDGEGSNTGCRSPR